MDNSLKADESFESQPELPSLTCCSSGTEASSSELKIITEQPQHQAVCDGDASYFDGGWVSSTVGSAVSHFFGNDEKDETGDARATGGDGEIGRAHV